MTRSARCHSASRRWRRNPARLSWGRVPALRSEWRFWQKTRPWAVKGRPAGCFWFLGDLDSPLRLLGYVAAWTPPLRFWKKSIPFLREGASRERQHCSPIHTRSAARRILPPPSHQSPAHETHEPVVFPSRRGLGDQLFQAILAQAKIHHPQADGSGYFSTERTGHSASSPRQAIFPILQYRRSASDYAASENPVPKTHPAPGSLRGP